MDTSQAPQLLKKKKKKKKKEGHYSNFNKQVGKLLRNRKAKTQKENKNKSICGKAYPNSQTLPNGKLASKTFFPYIYINI